MRARVFEFLDRAVFEPGSELLGLLMHPHDELGPVDSLRESGVIFHGGGRCELAAGLPAFKDKGRKVGTGRVNRAGQPGAPRSHDDHIFHIARE